MTVNELFAWLERNNIPGEANIKLWGKGLYLANVDYEVWYEGGDSPDTYCNVILDDLSIS